MLGDFLFNLYGGIPMAINKKLGMQLESKFGIMR